MWVSGSSSKHFISFSDSTSKRLPSICFASRSLFSLFVAKTITGFIMRLSMGQRHSSITDAAPAVQAKNMKKSERVTISRPKTEAGVLPGAGNRVANCPARMLAVALLMNHTPMSNEARCVGERRLTSDSPMGESDSSPMVCRK